MSLYEKLERYENQIPKLVITGLLALGIGAFLHQPVKKWYNDRELKQHEQYVINLTEDRIQPPSPRGLEKRIKREENTQAAQPRKYAVIIGGQHEVYLPQGNLLNPSNYISNGSLIEENLSTVYSTLIKSGFKRRNIYVLDDLGDKVDKEYPVDDCASQESMEMLFDYLSRIITEKDMLLIYINGDGSLKTNQNRASSYLLIPGKDLYDTDLATLLKKLKIKKGLVFTETCYGGGFPELIGNGKFVAISSCSKDEVAYDGVFTPSFTRTFFNAWKDRISDINKDSLITLLENFDFSIRNNENTNSSFSTTFQRPQLKFDGLNPNNFTL